MDMSSYCKACEMDGLWTRTMSRYFGSQSSKGNICTCHRSEVIKGFDISTILEFSNSRFSRKWTECIDRGWLRELEQKEKGVYE